MTSNYKNNAIRGPINALIFNILSGYMDWIFGASKAQLFKDHPDTVVEIGSGAGANMRYLRQGSTLIAIEPNVHMHGNLKKSAKKYGILLEIKTTTGESIDLPKESCDFVVSTLVLCTVGDPIKCIEEVKKILKPGGSFVFIEHVRAKNKSVLRAIQNLLHKPWHWFFEGCHTNRDIKRLLAQGGFSRLELEEYNLVSPFIPIIPQIRGRAIK